MNVLYLFTGLFVITANYVIWTAGVQNGQFPKLRNLISKIDER